MCSEMCYNNRVHGVFCSYEGNPELGNPIAIQVRVEKKQQKKSPLNNQVDSQLNAISKIARFTLGAVAIGAIGVGAAYFSIQYFSKPSLPTNPDLGFKSSPNETPIIFQNSLIHQVCSLWGDDKEMFANCIKTNQL